MKRGTLLNVLLVFSIFLALSMPLVSAGLFGDFAGWFNNFFDSEDESSKSISGFAHLTDSGTNESWCKGADINKDGKVDSRDQNIIGIYWQREDCIKTNDDSSWCKGADINKDGKVDSKDQNILGINWQRDFCTGTGIICTDTDSGIDYFKKGEIYKGGEIIFEETIQGDSYLNNNDDVLVTSSTRSDLRLSSGKWIKVFLNGYYNLEPGQGKITEINFVSFNNRQNSIKIGYTRLEDTCSDNILIEKSCSSYPPMISYECLNGCKDGACVEDEIIIGEIIDEAWCKGADINKDGDVDNTDQNIIGTNWRRDDCTKTNTWCKGADINKDGKVDGSDQNIIGTNWRRTDCEGFTNPLATDKICTEFGYNRQSGAINYCDRNNNSYDLSVCSKVIDTCTDSDGKDYYTIGEVSYGLSIKQGPSCSGAIGGGGGGNTIKDRCDTSVILREYICESNGTLGVIQYACPSNCINGACIGTGSGPVKAVLSVATLKDSYRLGELVELTDPPSEDSNPVISYDEDKELLNNENGALFSAESAEPKIKGYIIELKEEPLIAREIDLKNDEEKARKRSDEFSKKSEEGFFLFNYYENLRANRFKNKYSKIKEKTPRELKKHAETIKEEHKDAIKDINRITNLGITGSVIHNGEPNEKEIRKFEYVFNGFVLLDISKEKAKEIEKSRYVKKVHPNYEVQIVLDSSIPAMDIDLARDYAGLTGEGITIAILDTGIDATHEALNDLDDDPNTEDVKVIGWQDYINFEPAPYDDNGHGTHVAGTAAGTAGADLIVNEDDESEELPIGGGGGGTSGIDPTPPGGEVGIEGGTPIPEPELPELENSLTRSYQGVAPRAKLVGVKVLDSWGSGTFDQVIAGIEWTIQNKDLYDVSIISMSLGANVNSDGTSPVEIAVDYAVASGINVVVAAGNRGSRSNTVGIPASAFDVITVGAVDDNMEIAGFSSRGPTSDGRLKPEVSAVGVDVIASVPRGNCNLCDSSGYKSLQGTSMATPHVSGFIALLLEQSPELNTTEIKSLLTQTSVDKGELGPDNDYGYGVLNGLETIFDILPPQHEISMVSIDSPNFLDLGDIINIEALIKNNGLNDEEVTVRFKANEEEQEIKDIKILSKQTKTVFFSYTTNEEGKYNLEIEVDSLDKEEIITNNKINKEITALDVKGSVNIVVVDSWGTDNAVYTIFDELNNNWAEFGSYIVDIDYETLDKEDITYQDLVNSNADVLIISDAWADSYRGMEHQFTDSEIQAIIQYVEEGHGLIGTSGTLSELVPNNIKLAELFGLKDVIGLWNDREASGGRALFGDEINVLVEDKILTNNLPTSYFPGVYKSILNLEPDENKEIVIVGKAGNRDDIFISAYKPNLGASVYFTQLVESIDAEIYDKQFFYNSLVWSFLNTGEIGKDISLSNLQAPKRIILNETEEISVIIKNNGNENETVIVEFKIDEVLQETKNIFLNSLEEKQIDFKFSSGSFGKNDITIEAIPLSGETYLINNKVKKSILVPTLLLNDVYNDYVVDENDNGKYDYIAIELGIDSFEDRTYFVNFDVTSFLGVLLESIYEEVDVSKQDNKITILVHTFDIRKMALNGPYKIKNLEIIEIIKEENDEKIIDSREEIIIDSREEAFTTQAYNINDFEEPSKFTRNFNDYGLDEDGDGLYDNLIIEIELDIKITGEYFVSGTISDESGFIFSESAGNFIDLEEGIQNVNLAFSGLDIRKSQIDGPYFLKNLELIKTDKWQEHDFINKAYETGLYGYEDFEDVSDVTARFNKVPHLLVNENNDIRLDVYNQGTKSAENVFVSLYLVNERFWNGTDYEENLSLIDSQIVDFIDVNEWENIFFSYTPKDTGWIDLKSIVSLENEDITDNNEDWRTIKVKGSGADLIIWTETWKIDYVVDKNSKIPFTIINEGTETAEDVVVSLYSIDRYCDEFDCYEDLTLIDKKSLSDIESDQRIWDEFLWEPKEFGWKNLKIEVESSNEVFPGDNYNYFSVFVKINAADLEGGDIYSPYNRVIGQETNVDIYIKNKGILTAEDVSASLYLSKSVYNGTEWVRENTFIELKSLANIDPDEKIEVEFLYTPKEVGWNSLLVVSSASNEGFPDDNDINFGINVVEKSMIDNPTNSEITGTLFMEVQKRNESSGWETVYSVVSDKIASIPALDRLALDVVWIDNDGYTTLENGEYRVYAKLVRPGETDLEDFYQFYAWN